MLQLGFVSFQTIFHPCSDYCQNAQNDDDDGKSVEAEVEQGHNPAPGRDQGEHCYIKCPFLGLGACFGQFSSNDISFHHELMFAMGLEF